MASATQAAKAAVQNAVKTVQSSSSSYGDKIKAAQSVAPIVSSATKSTSSSGSGASAAAARAVNQAVTAKSSGSSGSGSSGGAVSAAVNAINQAAGSKPTGTGTSTAGVNAGYTPKGTYNDAELRAADQAAQIDYWKNQWNAAKAAGDTAGMREAHAQAELIRAQQGYSGGSDGSQYIGTPQNTPANDWNVLYSATQNNPNYIDGVYVDPNDQRYLSATDLNTIIALKKEYPNASAERKAQINQIAEGIRAGYGYSLGSTGNRFSPVALEQDIMPQIGLPSLEANPEMINEIYDKMNDATLSQLMASYNNSRAQTEHDMSKIPALYQQQRNAASADNEREKLAFREQAAASGLNAGNRSQANLAYSNQLQNSLGQLNTAEANALSEMQFSLTQLYNSYQQQIAAAVAENNYQRVAALYEDYTRAKESAVNTALNQAQLNMQVAEFNRQTRQNKVANQQQAWQNQFALASELAGYNSMGLLGALGSLSSDELNRIQRDYNVLQLGQYYPILRGYL